MVVENIKKMFGFLTNQIVDIFFLGVQSQIPSYDLKRSVSRRSVRLTRTAQELAFISKNISFTVNVKKSVVLREFVLNCSRNLKQISCQKS